ncbi:MAG: hypothetical protein NVSMB59_13880 [Vulcanimicrobiaceae bacterium]
MGAVIAHARIEDDAGPSRVRRTRSAIEVGSRERIPMEVEPSHGKSEPGRSKQRFPSHDVEQVGFRSAPVMERLARTAAIVPRRNVVRAQVHDAIECRESVAEAARAVRLQSAAHRQANETTIRRGSVVPMGGRRRRRHPFRGTRLVGAATGEEQPQRQRRDDGPRARHGLVAVLVAAGIG